MANCTWNIMINDSDAFVDGNESIIDKHYESDFDDEELTNSILP